MNHQNRRFFAFTEKRRKKRIDLSSLAAYLHRIDTQALGTPAHR
jgi:hypothetical protein